MEKIVLTKTRIASGIWEGILSTLPDITPEISVTHLETELADVQLSKLDDDPSLWLLRIPIPPELLADGVQTFLITDKISGDHLSDFTVVTGEPLESDVRGELDLLRAELDMLKRAFRRHCVETS